MILGFAFLLMVGCASWVDATIIIDTPDYTVWRTPDLATDDASGIVTKPGVSLNGGGTDVDEAFQWMIDHANGGDFLVLRASGSDGYNDYIYKLSLQMQQPLHSVTSILCKNKNASFNEDVLKYIQQAEAIFFAGGDQSLYVNYWSNTPLQAAVQARVDEQVTVGGTSAGLALLGTRIYSAEHDTVYSDESLENPYNIYTTFANQFLKLPNFEHVVTDTHFSARDRMGRSLNFLARAKVDLGIPDYRSLGVDEMTAMLLDVQTGVATAVGSNNAFICHSKSTPSCTFGKPLQFSDILCHKASAIAKDTYDFVKRQGSGVDYSLNIVDGKLFGSPYGPEKA